MLEPGAFRLKKGSSRIFPITPLKEKGEFFMRILKLSLVTLFMLELGVEVPHGQALAPECSTSLPSGCYLTVAGSDLENIQFNPSPSTGDVRVMFRRKSASAKRFTYRDNSDEGAKGLLAVLLTAASTGMNIRIWITTGSYENQTVESQFKDIAINP